MYNEVQFEDQNVDFHRNARVVQKSTMVKLFEKMGVPEEYVSVVMIGVAVVFFVISVFVFVKSSGGDIKQKWDGSNKLKIRSIITKPK